MLVDISILATLPVVDLQVNKNLHGHLKNYAMVPNVFLLCEAITEHIVVGEKVQRQILKKIFLSYLKHS